LVVLFDTNIGHLFIVLVITSIQTYAIVAFRGCPLTKLERRYTSHNHKRTLQQWGIGFKCDHEYESSLETMMHVWLAVAVKIFALMLLKAMKRNV
jgi:hypothetical protein